MSKHSYTIGCSCNRCEKEKTRRLAQSKLDQRPCLRDQRSQSQHRQTRSWNDWHERHEFDIQAD